MNGATTTAATTTAGPRRGSLDGEQAGRFLLAVELAHAGIGSWSDVDRWAAALTADPISGHPDDCGLFRGAPAVAVVLHAAQRGSYRRALEQLDAQVTAITADRLTQASARRRTGQPTAMREYDLISGLTGLGVYQLRLHPDGRLIRDVLTYLVRLTEPVTTDGDTLPGWWCAEGPSGHTEPHWADGHANLGMAHGISGPLALLATALRHGVTVPGQAQAIDTIRVWLHRWRQGTGRTAWWPGFISRAEHRAGASRQSGPQRPSWCYGTAGIGRALQLAALAVDDRRAQHEAETTLAGCLTDGPQLTLLDTPGLCHGLAGLLVTAWTAASEPDARPEFAAAIPGILAELAKRSLPQGHGLLGGATGIQLAVRAAATAARPITAWHGCLLLAS